MPENDDEDVNLPYKWLNVNDKGIVVGLENSGSQWNANTQKFTFLAGTLCCMWFK
jgi:hypothetical protein